MTYESYLVKRGDCLWNLAKARFGDPLRWRELAALNGITRPPYWIFIGQKLRLPSWSPASPVVSRRVPPPATATVNVAATPDATVQQPARLIRHPAYKFQDKFTFPIEMPNLRVEVTLKLNLTVQLAGTIPQVTVENFSAIEIRLQENQARQRFNGLSQSMLRLVRFKYDAATGRPELGIGVTAELRHNGVLLSTQRIEVMADGAMKYIYQPAPIEGSYLDTNFRGTVELEVVLRPKNSGDPLPGLQPAPIPVFEGTPALNPLPAAPGPSTDWQWAFKGAAIITGVAIIVGTLAEDVVTAGGGVADDPVSFAAAWEIIQAGLRTAPAAAGAF